MSRTDLDDALDGAAIRAAVAGRLIGRELILLDSAGSTNDVVLKSASAGAPEGLAVFAEEQTAGRGQYGRTWNSASRKSLLVSILLRPDMELAESPRLTRWLAGIVARTVAEEFALVTSIKAPNDVCIGAKKLAGVLVEMRAVPGQPHAGIAGIGLNVNQSENDFANELRGTATSIAMTLGREVSRTQLAIALLRALDAGYRDGQFLAA